MCENTIISNPINITVNLEDDIFAPTLRGDGSAIQNLNASNLAFGHVNSILIYGNTLSNISASNIVGTVPTTVLGNTLSNLNASNLAFGIVNSTLIYGNQISNINSSNITQPFATANIGTLNVSSCNVLSLNVFGTANGYFGGNFTGAAYTGGTFYGGAHSGTTITASTGFTGAAFTGGTFYGGAMTGTTVAASTGFTGAAYTGGTFYGTTLNTSSTSNLSTTYIKSSNISGTSNMVGAVTVMGGMITPTTSTSTFNGPLIFNSTFSPGVLAGNIRNIIQGTSSIAGVNPGPVGGTLNLGVTLTGTTYALFFQPRYGASQTIFSITTNTYTTTTANYYAYRITGIGSTCNFDWMLIDYNA